MPSKATSPRAKRVWQRLIEWYGTRVTEQFGPEPPRDWVEVIDRSDNELVKRGLSVIRTKYFDHPPTLPQFEQAFAPVKTDSHREPSIAEKLAAYAIRHFGARLSPKQLRGPWTYIGKRFDAADTAGKTIKDHGIEISAVVIDADGDHPGFRVMLDDMIAESALEQVA